MFFEVTIDMKLLLTIKRLLTQKNSIMKKTIFMAVCIAFGMTFMASCGNSEKRSGKDFVETVDNDDDLNDDEDDSDDINLSFMQLKTEIDAYTAQLPLELEPGLTCTNAKVVAGECIYYYSVDETKYSIDNFRQNASTMKQTVKSLLTANNAKEFTELIVKADIDLKYVYVGDTTGETFELTLSNNELKRLVD